MDTPTKTAELDRTVNTGTEKITIGSFSTYKALRMLEQVKRLMNAYPDLIADVTAFVRQYESENVMELDRATALYQLGPDALGHLTDADWENSGQKLRLPRSPSLEEQIFHAFPNAFEKARTQTLELCALAVMTNDELERTETSGGEEAIDKAVTDRAANLKHKALIDEMLHLLVVTAVVLEEQVGNKIDELREHVGNVRKLFGFDSKSTNEAKAEPIEGTATEKDAQSTDPAQAKEASQTQERSSTSSPTPSDGTAGQPSTAPPGSPASTSASE